MEISKIKTLLHERWKFYAFGYAFGYVISIVYMGVPNVLYLIPLKVSCIVFAILIGSTFYYGSIKMRVFEGTFRMIKYVLFITGLLILSVVLEYLMAKIGIDLSPFIGM